MSITPHVRGAGLGLRRSLTAELQPLSATPGEGIGFLEIAPENWMGVGGSHAKTLRSFTERFPFVCHGLSLSIGSPAPLDETFVRGLKAFLDTHGIADYTEHLTFCSDSRGHLYDLMPIPFTEEAVHYVAGRVRRVQEILERRIALHQDKLSHYREIEQRDFLNGKPLQREARIHHMILKKGIMYEEGSIAWAREMLQVLGAAHGEAESL